MVKDTIISAFNYDGTLLKWLKKVQEALENASASEFRVNKKGNATISFSIVFANGDTLESDDIILQQGESVTGATIRQGHLILTLSNGNELDAGDLGGVSGFSINASQHLIVTYQNGSTQDLGAIFSGNVVINGNLTIGGGAVSTPILTSSSNHIEAQKPIIEVMNGYSCEKLTEFNWSPTYAGISKNGNKVTLVVAGSLTYETGVTPNSGKLCKFTIPISVGAYLFPFLGSLLDVKKGNLYYFSQPSNDIVVRLRKVSDIQLDVEFENLDNAGIINNQVRAFRVEYTLLLSENLLS